MDISIFQHRPDMENGVFPRLCRSSFAAVRDCADFSVTRTGVEQGDFKRIPPTPSGSDQKQPGRLPVAA
jgi:hypothetical protein